MTAALTRAGVPCSSRGVWVTVTVDRSSGRLSSQVSFRWLLLIIDSRVVRFYTDAGMSSQHMHRRLVLSSIILPAAMIAALYLALPGGSPRFASAQISTQPNVIARTPCRWAACAKTETGARDLRHNKVTQSDKLRP